MLLRRAGGHLRWLPADVATWPLTLVGLWLLAGLDWVTNQVADGPWTVRILVSSPLDWLTHPLGWLGLLLIALGVLCSILSRKLARGERWGIVMRYWPYQLAALALLVGVVLSSWRTSGYVSDMASAGAQWRFIAEPRTRLINDVTTILLALGATACWVLSFGRRPIEVRQTKRERVPTTSIARAASTTTMPAGVPSQTRSRPGVKPTDDGS